MLSMGPPGVKTKKIDKGIVGASRDMCEVFGEMPPFFKSKGKFNKENWTNHEKPKNNKLVFSFSSPSFSSALAPVLQKTHRDGVDHLFPRDKHAMVSSHFPREHWVRIHFAIRATQSLRAKQHGYGMSLLHSHASHLSPILPPARFRRGRWKDLFCFLCVFLIPGRFLEELVFPYFSLFFFVFPDFSQFSLSNDHDETNDFHPHKWSEP